MSYLPYRPEPIDQAIVADQELSLEEQGAFLNLKRAMWRNDGSLPNDPYILARASKAGRRWPRIMAALCFHLRIVDGRVLIDEISTMLKLAIDRRAKAVNARARSQNGHAQLAESNQLKRLDSHNVQVPLKSASSRDNENKYIDSKNLSSKNAAAGRRASEAYFEAGAKLLTERTGIRFMAARHQIARWLAAVDGEEAELNSILGAARAENLRGPHFVAVVDQQIAARNREMKKGLPLPFPPGLVINRGK
jgi:uncharacterized protein YdaU (DUF1376 family)